MDGGAESGFNHVKPLEYEPRLLHFHGDKHSISLVEVPLLRLNLTSDDVFILDLGLKFYQWNGRSSNKDERFKAAGYMQKLKSERNKSVGETLDEDETSEDHEFYSHFPLSLKNWCGTTPVTSDDPAFNPAIAPKPVRPIIPEDKIPKSPKVLLKVSDESGQLKINKVKTGSVTLKDFVSKDVFIFDTSAEVFVWIGRNASKAEKQNGIGYAHNYLMDTDHPLIPVHVIKEGQVNKAFQSALAA